MSSRPELFRSIEALLGRKGNRVLASREIHERLASELDSPVSPEDVEQALTELESRGVITSIRGKRYSLLEFTPYVSGKMRVHPDGYGTLFLDDVHNVLVDRKKMKGAMNGDLVLVHVDRREHSLRKIKGKSVHPGEVTRILQREHRLVVGRFHTAPVPFIRPFDTRLDEDIEIDPEATLSALEGEMVYVEIDQYAERNSLAQGRVIERLGMIGDPGVDIEVVIRKYHIPHRFPDEVLAAADSIGLEIDSKEIAKRVDLRERTIFTIDGETAKDFDDAIEVERLPNGTYRLGVHIADVGHYVTEDSILDREAFERGTSVYFPGRAVPMLPERLSNGICSLNPKVDRLTFSVDVKIDAKGRFVDRSVFKSVIRTRERMTYTDVHAILNEPTTELRARYSELFDHFQAMHELYGILRTRRESRGSIDFDLPEADVLLSELGEIETIAPSERNVAHRIIEEFMLVANEIVAQQLDLSHQPAIYRVHHPPDAQRVEDLKEILNEFKFKLRGDAEEIRPGELQKVLKDVAGTPEERFLTEIVLRSMKRALYSEVCDGHFALALQHYCHFTSPIRRYPDLIIHRRLEELIRLGSAHGERLERLEADHPGMALQSSNREKRAEDAEREVLEWKKVIFMRDKVGMTFAGRVTGVVAFGLFVELDDYFVQGLVPVSSVGGDYWAYLEREHRLRGSSTGREFRLGDAVVVLVHSIDDDRRQIEFRLVESSGTTVKQRSDDEARPRRGGARRTRK